MGSYFPVLFFISWNYIRVSCEELETTMSNFDETGEPRKMISKDMMSKIMPLLASPFMMQAMFMPIALSFMKFVLLNSILIGKLGIILWIINIFRNRVEPEGGLYSHNVNVHHNDHPAHIHYPKKEGVHYGVHHSYKRRRR